MSSGMVSGLSNMSFISLRILGCRLSVLGDLFGFNLDSFFLTSLVSSVYDSKLLLVLLKVTGGILSIFSFVNTLEKKF